VEAIAVAEIHKSIAQISQPAAPTNPPLEPYIWGALERIGIPGAILVFIFWVTKDFATQALKTFWVNQVEDRAEAKAEREAERKERDADRKAIKDITDTALAKTFNTQQILLDDLAETQKAIADMVKIQAETQKAIASTIEIQAQTQAAIRDGFTKSSSSQDKQSAMLAKISMALEKQGKNP
jgi:hypothetical protein